MASLSQSDGKSFEHGANMYNLINIYNYFCVVLSEMFVKHLCDEC